MEKGRLTEKPVELEVEWDGETCKIVYNRRAITFNTLKDASDFTRGADDETDLAQSIRNVGFLIKQLKRFLLKWDLTDKGKPVPITEQELGGFDPDFLSTLFDAIMADIRPPNSPRPEGNDGSTSQAKEPGES